MIVYRTIEEGNEAPACFQTTVILGISVTKIDCYDGKYIDEYERYVIDGPASFSQVYETNSIANWNTSMTASASVGGTLYNVAEVKAAVSGSMGFTIGREYKKTSTYAADIQSGKYWEIKAWTNYRVFLYTAKVGSAALATGKSWHPNGYPERSV
ncbi:MAG: hypothetical protein LBK75_11690 [Oscillospiraceae bacterium]|nr:hypothetical protein [Oscillospiraceae bacterium]